MGAYSKPEGKKSVYLFGGITESAMHYLSQRRVSKTREVENEKRRLRELSDRIVPCSGYGGRVRNPENKERRESYLEREISL